MGIQGLNLLFSVIQTNSTGDDSIGGSLVTGTLTQENVRGRIDAARPTQGQLEQGFETPRLWTLMAVPQNLDVVEDDEVEITQPLNHPLVGQRLLVRGVRVDSIHPTDGRGHVEITVAKIAHGRSDP